MIQEPFYNHNPYAGFRPQPTYMHGWGYADEAMEQAIQYTGIYRAQTIVEVGSWLGGSTLRFAQNAPRARIYCVDTWLGASEFWYDLNDPDRHQRLELVHGYPSVYYQFLSNVVNAGYADQISPLPMDSQMGARVLLHHNVSADVIYIDASHEYEDVLRDIDAYARVLKPHGTLFGDDYTTWHGVRDAVNAVHSRGGWQLVTFDRFWILRPNHNG